MKNGITILIAGITIHELIVDSDEAEGENRVVTVSLFIPHQMLLYDELLEDGVVDAGDWSLVRF